MYYFIEDKRNMGRYLSLCYRVNFKDTRVYREGNKCITIFMHTYMFLFMNKFIKGPHLDSNDGIHIMEGVWFCR